MKTSYVFLAEGFEEIEALTCVDVLRRAGINVKTVSIKETLSVTGAHGITVEADMTFSEGECSTGTEWLIMPGGMPGALNLHNHDKLGVLIQAHNAKGGRIAAICAAPAVVLAPLGVLKGKSAVCYPGFETQMEGSKFSEKSVAVDGNVVTANGPATAIKFALTIVEKTLGAGAANKVAEGMLEKAAHSNSDYYLS